MTGAEFLAGCVVSFLLGVTLPAVPAMLRARRVRRGRFVRVRRLDHVPPAVFPREVSAPRWQRDPSPKRRAS